MLFDASDSSLSAEGPPANLRNRFAITPLLDTEIDVAAAGWVGLTPEADHELRVDVTAAVIARFMSVSVTTARKYARDVQEHLPRDQLIRHLCQSHIRRYDEFYRTMEIRSGGPIGVFAFDLAMIRSRASIQLMLATARQGFLIEPCLMARSIIEQFAYTLRVWMTDEDEIIFASKAAVTHPLAERRQSACWTGIWNAFDAVVLRSENALRIHR